MDTQCDDETLSYSVRQYNKPPATPYVSTIVRHMKPDRTDYDRNKVSLDFGADRPARLIPYPSQRHAQIPQLDTLVL